MNLREYKRRSFVPLAGLALTAYYLLVLVPLSHRANSLDEPLQKAWRRLAASLEQTNAMTIDFLRITNQLAETRQALVVLENARQRAVSRLEPAPLLRTRMSEPFQLVEYENERSKLADDLAVQARKQQVALDPSVFEGFPMHTADVNEPTLLWAALALADDLLETALVCKVSTIHALKVPVTLTNYPSAESTGRWATIPVEMEFTAPADRALQLLESLPLRAAELKAAGLPPGAPGKAPLFLERLILRKQSPAKFDEVRVWLRAVGFVLRE